MDKKTHMEQVNKYNSDQLLNACGIMESTIIKFIRDLDSKNIDTSALRQGLNEAHLAVDGIEQL